MANYEKPDTWTLRARREAYPARSVYKLKEMDEKFRLIPASGRAFRALDLGAAPGSWSLYTLRKLSGGDRAGQAGRAAGGFLAAADLSPLSRQYDRGLFDGENFRFIQGDIRAEETRSSLLSHAPYRLVMSDAAPATTGNRQIDTLRSLELAEAAFYYGETALEKGGNLVLKVFQGGDTAGLLKRIRELFETARSFKPAACRRESFEIYYLGLGRN
ncbi:MAG: RlmE family RNA methyltransferase [Treponema sp.]|jgi:23S rRNA (uridine2552-2'-O)-methyltransferase|nr:RlmE family RNA methyltransferase [Treponema sp.]